MAACFNLTVVDPGPDGQGIVVPGQSGFHVNVARSILTPEMAAFEVTPAEPMAVWAGDYVGVDGLWVSTAFLRFASEAQALTVLAGFWFEAVDS